VFQDMILINLSNGKSILQRFLILVPFSLLHIQVGGSFNADRYNDIFGIHNPNRLRHYLSVIELHLCDCRNALFFNRASQI